MRRKRMTPDSIIRELREQITVLQDSYREPSSGKVTDIAAVRSITALKDAIAIVRKAKV